VTGEVGEASLAGYTQSKVAQKLSKDWV